MSDQERLEGARASREAVDHVAAHPPTGPATEAVDAALRRYLAAEQYHQQAKKPAHAEDDDEDEPTQAEKHATEQSES